MSNAADPVRNVDEAGFQREVVERSRQVPVVVDFWAEWCGPCRQLGPALEAAVRKRAGRVELAKVDVDRNQSVAASFGVRGIPAVKAFRDGTVADEFTGAIPPARIEQFLDGLVPSEADELARSGDEDSLRAALAADPRHAGAATSLARILLRRGEDEEAAQLLESFEGDFMAEGLAARARLALHESRDGGGAGPGEAFAAWDAGDHSSALDRLQEALEGETDPEVRDMLRKVMVAIFTELGPGSELARRHRRRLAAALA